MNKQKTYNLDDIMSCLHGFIYIDMNESAAYGSKIVCLSCMRENAMWDPGDGYFIEKARCVRYKNVHDIRKKKEKGLTTRLSFGISFLKNVAVSSIYGIEADEKRQKIHCKSLCSINDWSFHGPTDSCMRYYFSIPIKMKRKVGGVACAVACQVLVH